MDNAAIAEIFAVLGDVSIRRMFGGKGIYAGGRIVAVEVAGEILLKADAQSAPDFVAAGCVQWTYDGRNGPVKMPYWSVPADAFDDRDEMNRWVRLAAEAAARAPK